MHRMTAGVTRTKFSREPLAFEEELTPGDSTYNPFDDPGLPEETKRALEYPGVDTFASPPMFTPLDFDGPMF